MKLNSIWVWREERWNKGLLTNRFAPGNKSFVIIINSQEEVMVDNQNISDSKDYPGSPPAPKGGVKLSVSYNQSVLLRSKHVVSRLSDHFDKGDSWEELYDADMTVVWAVTDTVGYENPLICGYCEEYSSDTEDCSCEGCGRKDWVKWEELEYPPRRRQIGETFEPDF